MKQLVFGTGLIGGFLAGGLLAAGFSPLVVGRDRHRQAFASGLIISDLNGNQTELETPSFYDVSEHGRPDIVWLTVKCTAVASAISELQTMVSDNTIIVCCQNGFGSDTSIRQAFPNNVVLNAVVGFNVAQQKPHHFHRSTDGALVVEANSYIDPIIAKLNSSILPAHSSQEIEAERWAKLQLNLANPVNALADIPTKAMVEDPDFRRVIAALMLELLTVTKKLGFKLPKLTALPATVLPTVMRLPNWIYLILAQKTLAIDPTARVSMWWDLSQGKQSEIQFLNQAVVDKGQELGIQCPFNERIVALINKVESGDLKIGLTGKQLQQELGIK